MKQYEKELKQLEKLYVNAEKRLIDIITKKTIKNQSTDFYKAMLKEVQLELNKVQIASVRLSKSIVKDLYQEALEKALNSLQIDISDGFTAIHKEAITILTNNLVNNFADVNNMVGRQIADNLRDIGLDSASTKFASGQTIKEMQRELRKKLLSENLLGIVDKRGRVIPYTTYAELLSRSIVAETQNTSVLNVAKEYDKDLVRMSNHRTSCPTCLPYENKIYSISGESEEYPALKSIPGFSKGYNNIHPRCRHRITVYQSKFDDNYWDRDKAEKEAKAKDGNIQSLKDKRKDIKNKYDKTIGKAKDYEIKALDGDFDYWDKASKEYEKAKAVEKDLKNIDSKIFDKQSLIASETEKRMLEKGLADKIKLSGKMDYKSMEAIEKTLEDLIKNKRLPKIDSIVYAPNDPRMGGAVAFYDPEKSRIVLSNYFDDYDDFFDVVDKVESNSKLVAKKQSLKEVYLKNIEEAEKVLSNKDSSKGDKALAKQLRDNSKALLNSLSSKAYINESIEDVIRHEFGHHLQNMATSKLTEGIYIPREKAKYLFGKDYLKLKQIKGIWDFKETDLTGKILASSVSKYAISNPAEAFAEAFLCYEKGIDMPLPLKEMIEEAIKLVR